MTKRKPKRRPRRTIVDDGKPVTDLGRIPNAEEVARSLASETETSGGGSATVRINYVVKTAAEAAEAMAFERGRTIGRLEALQIAFMDTAAPLWLKESDQRILLPILRAEIARLRSAKP